MFTAVAGDKISRTRYPELGYHRADSHWRVLDITDWPNVAEVGPLYRTKAELLADLSRYAQNFWGYSE